MVRTIQENQKNSNDLLNLSIKCFKSIKEFVEKAQSMLTILEANPDLIIPPMLEREKFISQMNSGLLKVTSFSFVGLSHHCRPLLPYQLIA